MITDLWPDFISLVDENDSYRIILKLQNAIFNMNSYQACDLQWGFRYYSNRSSLVTHLGNWMLT